ncbi:MAG: hypothetical protein EOP34_06035 [Rickettsiales bacterium]|nr:MAG: hypothetical protein EOP34_06035 [Rickettsiales bacterium]
MFSDVIAGSPPRPVLAPGAFLYLLHFVVIMILAIRQLSRGFGDGIDSKKRQQYKLIILGISPILFLAPLTSFVLPNIFDIDYFVVLTPLYALFFVMCVGYAILKHGLFDIKLAAVRSTAYLFSLASLGIIYYMLAYAVSITVFQGHKL